VGEMLKMVVDMVTGTVVGEMSLSRDALGAGAYTGLLFSST